MRPLYAYLYLLEGSADVEGVAQAHGDYWDALRLDSYRGGPFEDRTGGLITFAAADRDVASRFVDDDPFVKAGLVTQSWLKRWEPINVEGDGAS